MDDPCVIFGDEQPPGAAFAASGCSSMLGFLSSPLLLHHVRLVSLSDRDHSTSDHRVRSKGTLYISAKGVRDRKEAREAGGFARFLHALPLLNSLTSLAAESVDFVSLDELSALCSAIGSPLCTLGHLRIWDVTIRGVSSPRSLMAQTFLKDALLNNTSLTSLSLRSWSPECIIPALTRTPCSIKKVWLNLESSDYTLDDVSGILTGLAHNSISLTDLTIWGDWDYTSQPSHELQCILGTMLRTNTSLESLGLILQQLPGKLVEMLLASLEQNVHLTSLSLSRCEGPDWPSASFVLDCLRVNGILSRLNLRFTPLEGKSEAAIEAQLARNRERVKQVEALKEEGSAQVQPTTVRLFLCGLPFSGKTTLSRSLARWNSRTSNFTECFSCAGKIVPDRTRGIEVSTIENEKVKVSLWDMAGQAEYYAFHDHMFPNLSSDGTPSLFLFVWNPIEVDKSTGRQIKDGHGENMIKTPETFEHEFRYWLRFIASKTLLSNKFKPSLLVAITRADLQMNTRRWIKKTFEQCQEDFQEHVQFDMDSVFELDARHPCNVEDLALNIFQCAELLLHSKPPVYQACDLARTVLPKLIHTERLAPLITKQEFFFLCKKHLGLDSPEMQEAVALSLNESGDLIFFKSFDLVVVNTQWFCNYIMGDLLYFGNNKQQHNGFYSLEVLQGLLESRAKSTIVRGKQFTTIRTIFAKTTKTTNTPQIKGEDLVKLLMGLQLACQRDDDEVNSDIFVPASLCTIQREKVDPSQHLRGDDGKILTFMGRRLKCKDSKCTFFTPGIFCRLQVIFHKLLHIDRKVSLQLKEDVMAFAFGGVKVFMEFFGLEGEVHYIDILVSSSKKSLDDTIEWLQENVILHVEKICAEPRGIQGVELAHAVIQQDSIQKFLEASRRPAVLIEELQDELKRHVEKKGVDDGIKTAMYTWQIGNFPTDSVVDLLGEKETSKVIQTYLHALNAAYREISNLFVEEAETSQPQKPQFGMSQSSKEREILYDKFCQVEQTVMRDLKDLKHSIQDLHNAVQDLRNAVLPKLCKLFTFVKEGEAGKLPRMFMVTEDDGLVQRVVSAIVPGLQNMRLQLFCECRSESCHFVDGKRGMSLAKLDEGLLKRGLPYINAIVKVAYMVARIGAHVAVGFGDVIPDFTRVLANIVDAPVWDEALAFTNLKADDWNSSSRMNLKEGQQWVFDVLSNGNCTKGDQIYAVFGLRRVRLPDSRAAWLCDKHYQEGKPWPA